MAGTMINTCSHQMTPDTMADFIESEKEKGAYIKRIHKSVCPITSTIYFRRRLYYGLQSRRVGF